MDSSGPESERPDPSTLFPGPADLPLGFGTWALGGTDWGPIEPAVAKRLLRTARDLGFRHFDTAESYGNGRSEQLLGQALRDDLRRDRESYVIASKSVVRAPRPLGRHLERSLRRLGTEYVDLFYIHWPREGVDLHAAVEELLRQVDLGRIRWIGLSNVSRREYEEIAGTLPVAAVQAGYNALWRGPEKDLWPAVRCARVAYSPLAQGLLARPFPSDPDWPEGDHRQKTPLFSKPLWSAVHRFHQEYLRACRDHDLHPGATAIAWLLGTKWSGRRTLPRASAAVVGGRRPRDVQELVTGLEAAYTPEGARRCTAALEEVEQAYTRVEGMLPVLPNIFGYVPRAANP